MQVNTGKEGLLWEGLELELRTWGSSEEPSILVISLLPSL